MARVSYFFIISLFVLVFASRGYSLLNIEGAVNYAYDINDKNSIIGYGGGIGFDLDRIHPSVLLQLRITVGYRDFKGYSKTSELSLVDSFVGTRFIFGNDSFPSWFSMYLDTGLVFIVNTNNLGVDGLSINNFAIDIGLGFGVEFFVWEGLYLGISAHFYFLITHYPIVGPVIGYRIR